MKAYKGFHKDLTCLGYQFQENTVNRTSEANCRQNGFHCAENPLDCLRHYSDWKNSVYYMVEASGDMDEDDLDSKISCTELTLIKRLSLPELLAEGAGFMIRHPKRKLSSIVCRETGDARNGYAVIRGKNPKGKGKLGTVLVLLKEDGERITDVSMMEIDGKEYFPDIWYDVYGSMERGIAV